MPDLSAIRDQITSRYGRTLEGTLADREAALALRERKRDQKRVQQMELFFDRYKALIGRALEAGGFDEWPESLPLLLGYSSGTLVEYPVMLIRCPGFTFSNDPVGGDLVRKNGEETPETRFIQTLMAFGLFHEEGVGQLVARGHAYDLYP